MSIQNYLNQIKAAVFGKDVRQSIHDAIKQCYDDASVDHDNANMEVKLARGTHETLNDRITENEKNQENLSSQLDTKANEIDVVKKGQVDLDYMTERTLQAIRGGEGTSFSLLSEPREQSVNSSKLSPALQNVFKANTSKVSLTLTSGGYYNYADGTVKNDESGDYSYVEAISVKVGEEYVISGRSVWASNIYIITDSSGKKLETFPNTFETGKNYDNVKISIPTGGTKLLINSCATYPTKLYKVSTFSIDTDKIDSLKNGIVNIDNLDDSIKGIYKGVFSNMDITFTPGGYYQYNTGALIPNEGFQNAKIEVNEGEKYKINGTTSWEANLYIIIDKNNSILKVFPNTNKAGTTYSDIHVTIPRGGKYMLINQRNSIMNTTVKSVSSYTIKNSLKLKWVAFGDSLTDSATLGIDNYNYTNFVADALDLTLVNCGKGGTGYLNDNNRASKPFWNRTDTIPSDVDILTVFGSFNDVFVRNYTIGTINDTGTNTLYGAIKKFLNNCWNRNPSMVIGIITPTPWSGRWRGHTSNSDIAIKYVETLIDVAKYYSLPCLNLFDESNLRPWDSWFNSTYFKDGDGTHPNTIAHEKYIAPKIENFIKSIAK